MTAHDGIDATDTAGHLQVNVHTVVAKDHDHLSTLATCFINHGLHVLILDAEGPVRNHVTRVRNWCVRKSLSNDGAGHAIDFTNDVRLENRIAKIVGLDVLSHKIDLAGKVLFNDFLHALHAQCELPVARHHVHTQQFAGIHHILAVGPQRGTGALPGITTVEQQRTGTAALHTLDEGSQMRKASHLAVASGRLFIVQIGQRMSLRRAGSDASHLEQVLTHQMRQVALHRTQSDVDAGLTKMDGLELGVTIGHVQKRHISKFWNVVQTIGGGGRVGISECSKTHAGHGPSAQHLKELAFG